VYCSFLSYISSYNSYYSYTISVHTFCFPFPCCAWYIECTCNERSSRWLITCMVCYQVPNIHVTHTDTILILTLSLVLHSTSQCHPSYPLLTPTHLPLFPHSIHKPTHLPINRVVFPQTLRIEQQPALRRLHCFLVISSFLE
jgi:hypothetical protein